MKNTITNSGRDPLDKEDIEKLINSPMDKRMAITEKVAKFYNMSSFDESQRDSVEQIFRAILKDTEIEIRKILSNSLKSSSNVPKDIALSLASDASDVAIPMLETSDVLSDSDLIDIINSTIDPEKHLSITGRKSVSESVSEVLIEQGNEDVVTGLLNNQNAQVSENSYSKVVDRFSDVESVMSSIANRDSLPVSIVEELTQKVSDAIYKQLSDKHSSIIENIAPEIKKSREVATLKVMGMKSSDAEYEKFLQIMEKLNVAEEMVPISALCMGNVNLFEISIARLTKVSVANVRVLVWDESNRGFQALYQKGKLPDHLYAACELLIEVLRELKGALEEDDNSSMSSEKSNRIMEHLIMHQAEVGEVANIDYIITLIKHGASWSEEI